MCVSPYIAVSASGKHIPVPCGKCLDCRKAYQNEWTFRLSQEIKRCSVPVFITLTYNDENLPLGDLNGEPQSVLCKSDFQRFMKRLRKAGKDLLAGTRYFAVGEYGANNTNRCHFHAVLIAPNLRRVDIIRKLVEKCWTAGFSMTKFCVKKHIQYVTKYMNKLDERPHLVKPFRLYSKGIGRNFLTQKMIDYYLSTFDRTCISGKCHISLPRYYRRKLDELCESNWMMKKAGVKYSDLLPEIYAVPGTKYWYMKDFTERYEEIFVAARAALSVNGTCIVPVNPQKAWWYYSHCHKQLQDWLLESERKLHECRIRNKLKGIQPITQEYLEPL